MTVGTEYLTAVYWKYETPVYRVSGSHGGVSAFCNTAYRIRGLALINETTLVHSPFPVDLFLSREAVGEAARPPEAVGGRTASETLRGLGLDGRSGGGRPLGGPRREGRRRCLAGGAAEGTGGCQRK